MASHRIENLYALAPLLLRRLEDLDEFRLVLPFNGVVKAEQVATTSPAALLRHVHTGLHQSGSDHGLWLQRWHILLAVHDHRDTEQGRHAQFELGRLKALVLNNFELVQLHEQFGRLQIIDGPDDAYFSGATGIYLDYCAFQIGFERAMSPNRAGV